MANCYCERVRSVGFSSATAGQQALHHELDLRLLGVARSYDRLLHEVGRILCDGKPTLGRRQQHHASRDTQLQGRSRVSVDKSLLDGRLIGMEALEH